MVIIDGLSEIEYDGRTRIAIGKFDGVHAGHRKIINELTKKKDDLKSVVFTFSFNSDFFAGKNETILSLKEKRKKFENMDVDYLVEYELNEETASVDPEMFVREILVNRLHCKELVCGADLSFGYKGKGNVALIKSLEEELDISVNVIEKVKYLGEDISSTRIREAIKNGDTKSYKDMM